MEIKQEGEQWLAAQKVAAAFFGISVQAFQRWNCVPVRTEGRVKLYDVRAIMLDRYSKKGGEEAKPELMAERARLAQAQAEKVEMENAARRGELLEKADVLAAWSKLINNARQALLTLARRLTPVLVGRKEADIETEIDAEIRRILEELAGGSEPGD